MFFNITVLGIYEKSSRGEFQGKEFENYTTIHQVSDE